MNARGWKTFVLACVAEAALTAALAQAPIRGWTLAGPRGVNGWPVRIVFDPRDPRVAYAGCDDTVGLYRSSDGGATWRRLAAYGGAVDATALAVGSDGRVLAGGKYGHGLKVSTDGGATFTVATGFATGYVGGVAIHPAHPTIAFAAEGLQLDSDGQGGHGPPLSHTGGLYRSADGGFTWARVGGGLPADGPFTSVTIHPADPNVVLATRSADVWRSGDAGATWVEVLAPRVIPGGVRYVGGSAVAVSHVNPSLVLLAANVADVTLAGLRVRYEIWRSVDRGVTWSATAAPVSTGLSYYDIVAAPAADEYYAFGFHDGGHGIVRSRGTSGTTWQSVTSAPNRALFTGTFVPDAPDELLAGFLGYGLFRYDTVRDAWTRSGAGLAGGGCDGLTIDAGVPERWIVACGNTGLGPVVASSDDFGRTWISREPADLAFHGFHSGGAIENAFLPVLADRTAPGTVLLGGDVLRRSTDRGATWSALAAPAYAYSLAQGADGALYAAGYGGTVSVSRDHGATFTSLGTLGCDGALARVFASATAPQRLVAACASADPAKNGVSAWDGTRWQRLADPGVPPREQAWAASVDPFDEHRVAALYVLDADTASPGPPDQRYYGSHVVVSTDGGAAWHDVTPPLGCALARTVLFLGDGPAHLVVGGRTADGTCPGSAGRLWESFDAGTTWRDATSDWTVPHSYEWIGDDPLLPGRLFLSSWYDGVSRWTIPPAEVTGARFDGATYFAWAAQPGASGYDVARAPLAALHAQGLGAFVPAACGATVAFLDDPALPPAGDGYGYLVRASRRGDDGTWGTTGRDAAISACTAAAP